VDAYRFFAFEKLAGGAKNNVWRAWAPYARRNSSTDYLFKNTLVEQTTDA